jgi:hypothetical protein
MHDESLPPGMAEPFNPRVRFERRDANIYYILLAAGAIVAVAVAVHLLISGLFGDQIARLPVAGSSQTAAGASRLVFPQDFSKVPAPRLQLNDARDLAKLRQQEIAFLDNDGRPAAWVVKGKVVSVPIDEAMRLLSDPQTAKALGILVRPAVKAVEGKK